MLIQAPLRFSEHAAPRPPLRGSDVVTTLEQFSIITFTVDPEVLAKHLHPRFEPVLVDIQGAGLRGLISAVPFRDVDFHFTRMPGIRMAFGQTNYRAYVWDTVAGG